MANRNQGQNQGGTGRSGTSNRGFASMDQAQQREIARMGGEAVSENRLHMAEIGRKGGEASAESRAQARALARARGNGEAVAAPRIEEGELTAHEARVLRGTTQVTEHRATNGNGADRDAGDDAGTRGRSH